MKYFILARTLYILYFSFVVLLTSEKWQKKLVIFRNYIYLQIYHYLIWVLFDSQVLLNCILYDRIIYRENQNDYPVGERSLSPKSSKLICLSGDGFNDRLRSLTIQLF